MASIEHESAMDPYVLSDQTKGLFLAVSSSAFIGASFIIKKKGLRLAGANGTRAGAGGYAYLQEPMWWIGMITMILGEIANFAAYAFAPAVLVTPLGALSIIVSAILAHLILSEKLNVFGIMGCILCITGSICIVLHAPQEKEITSLLQVWGMALQPEFMCYVTFVMAVVIVLIFHVAPKHGSNNIFVYVGICSLVGSLSVMSCKALGIAIKLTFAGNNQLMYKETMYCVMVVVVSVVTQMNYLNKALDIFNTAIVSPIYYVLFTTSTIVASVIMFKDWRGQTEKEIITEFSGFLTILCGTFLLHMTKDMDVGKHTLLGKTSSTLGRQAGAILDGGIDKQGS
mmetsp:Transcript_56037/g.177567  ORF Transcript_56037/g.177567 Transcript_56037/m.177567 type:complete len:342 (+) Transcript_56037:128-1153(+)